MQHVVRQSEVVKVLVTLRAAEEPHDRSLAIQRGEGADAHFHVFLRKANAALLRAIGVVGEQPGQDLQPGGDVGGQAGRKAGHRQKHAVEAKFQLQPRAGRLEVNVAGAGGAGGGQRRVDRARGVLRIGRVKAGQLSVEAVGHLPSRHKAERTTSPRLRLVRRRSA